jgi:hypothetical protein
MACAGDGTTTCGGPNRLSLYGTSAEPPTATPYPHPGGEVTAPQYMGCWTEVVGVRALPGASAFSATAMTVDGCANYCLNSGFVWFGLEYSAECYCGSALDANSTAADETECNWACSGDATEVCGGSDRFSFYQWVLNF